MFDADYVWHDLALKWQPSEIGEQVVAQMAGMSAEARAHQHESYGMTSAIAQKVAAGASVDIGKAVLAVYRSAAQPVMRDLGSGLSRATTKRGLALIATDDPTAAALARLVPSSQAHRSRLWKERVIGGCVSGQKGADAINKFLAQLNQVSPTRQQHHL